MISLPPDILQIASWFAGLVTFIVGLYILFLNVWHIANRHVGALLVLTAINGIATGALLTARNAAQAALPLSILAMTTPLIMVGLLPVSIVLVKPAWMQGRRRWLWWGAYGLMLLPAVLTLADLIARTQLWYTGVNPQTYAGGVLPLNLYAAGQMSLLIRVGMNLVPVSAALALLYIAVFDKEITSATRRMAWLLLGAIGAVIAIQLGLQNVLTIGMREVLSSLILALAYAYAGLQEMISERIHQRGKLQTRLTLLILAITISVLVAVVAFMNLRAQALLEKDAEEQLRTSNESIANSVSVWLNLSASALNQLVSLDDIVSMEAERQKPILQAMAAAYPMDMYLISTTDLKGINVARNDDEAPKDYKDRLWFQGAVQGAPLTLQTLQSSRTTGNPALVMSVPIRDKSGAIVGVGMFASELSSLAQQVRARKIGNTGFAYVTDASNLVVAQPDPPFFAQSSDLSAYPPIKALRQGAQGIQTFTDEEGQQWRAYISTLDNGWGVIIQQRESELLGTLRTFRQGAWILLGVGIALILALSWLSIRQALRPIGALMDTVTAITAGDLSRTAPVESGDEIGALARAFNSMTDQIRTLIGSLEQRIAERTADLERRSSYLQASAQVASAASSILDTEQLINQVVELIRERFDLYYVGLFLIDEAGQWAVLRAGTGQAGQAMLARGHRRKVGEGMVGWSVANAQARVALEAGADAVRLGTAELPDTRSEAAIPLRSRDRVLGALTVQSAQPGVFDQDTVAVLQTMADQVAVALDNARLFAESQQALNAMRRTSAQLRREAWSELLRARPALGYRSEERGITEAEDIWRPEMEQALHTGQVAFGDGGDEVKHPLAVPIQVRGNVIGVLDTCQPDEATQWTPDQVALLEALAEQIGLALDNMRLFEDTQRRAVREQIIGAVTTRMRETLDIEAVLQTAAQEMCQRLNLAAVEVRMGGSKL